MSVLSIGSQIAEVKVHGAGLFPELASPKIVTDTFGGVTTPSARCDTPVLSKGVLYRAIEIEADPLLDQINAILRLLNDQINTFSPERADHAIEQVEVFLHSFDRGPTNELGKYNTLLRVIQDQKESLVQMLSKTIYTDKPEGG